MVTTVVRFIVSDSRKNLERVIALTRGHSPGLTDKDLDGKKLAVQSSRESRRMFD